MATTDLLGELCQVVVAQDVEQEQENRTVNDGRSARPTRAGNGKGKPRDDRAIAPSTTTTTTALAVVDGDTLVAMYRTACEAESEEPCEEHVRLLSSIPGELVMDARRGGAAALAFSYSSKPPFGAVLRVTSGSPEQVGALLTTLAPPAHAEAVAVVDTLDLTGLRGRVPHEALADMLDNALLWGPWWRLRCLVLRDCGLTPMHVRALGRLDTVPCLWNLEVLDLSDNDSIGTDPATGTPRGPGEYAGADVAFLVYLWKQAKLRRISLKGCKLGTTEIEALLKVLLRYHVPSEQGMECGELMHGGSRYFLECLELGDCDDAVVDTLAAVLSALPKIACVDVDGLGEASRRRLAELIKGKQLQTDGDGGGDRGEEGEEDDDDDDDDDTPSTVICTRKFDLGSLQPPTEHVLPVRAAGVLADADAAHPKLPQQLLDDFGLNEIVRRDDVPMQDTAEVVLKATKSLDKYGLNLVSPGRIAARSRYSKKQRRGDEDDEDDEDDGDDDDEMFRAREIEIRSDDDRKVDGETSSSDSEGGIPRERPTHDQINFKIRDGALDEDSRMGRVYRATAKKNIASLPEKKRKAARRAFGLWDQCTENSWDRRRWTNPSRTQFDSPEILGQLNLLFDILHEEALDIGFPFPLWRPGQGARAFLPEEEEEEAEAVEEVREVREVREVELDLTGSGERGQKKRMIVDSD